MLAYDWIYLQLLAVLSGVIAASVGWIVIVVAAVERLGDRFHWDDDTVIPVTMCTLFITVLIIAATIMGFFAR